MKRFWAPALLLCLSLLPLSAFAASSQPERTPHAATYPTSSANPAPAANQTIPDNRLIPDTGIRYNKAFLWLLFALATIMLFTIIRPSKRRFARQYLPLEARPFRRPKVDPTLIPRRRPRINLTNTPR